VTSGRYRVVVEARGLSSFLVALIQHYAGLPATYSCGYSLDRTNKRFDIVPLTLLFARSMITCNWSHGLPWEKTKQAINIQLRPLWSIQVNWQ